MRPFRLLRLLVAFVAFLAGCTVGPDYVRPRLDVLPVDYKEAAGWKPAEPRPVDARQPWWEDYGDPVLSRLMVEAERANPTLRVAEAQYRQATALADQARAGLYPSVGATASVQRARSAAAGYGEVGALASGLAASWVPDLWGGVRRSLEAGEATAAASADDLAGALLSLQSVLAQNYFALRNADQQRDLYAATIQAYERALRLVRAQRAAGVALLSDVALAESQLANAQAQAVDLEVSRAQLEHAIATLTGRAPSQLVLPAATVGEPFAPRLPAPPAGLPSELLERRPDIAAAERRAAAANAGIGVARAAYYPSLTLGAGGGFAAATLGTLLEAPARVWSLGASLAQTVFDGGLRRARDAQAVSAWDAVSAQYRQTVLNGFQQVEDNLVALRVLAREIDYQDAAVRAGQTAERLALVQYRAGTTTFLAVVTAQTLSLASQRAAVQLRGRQLAASVGLIVATGGGWSTADVSCVAGSSPPSARAESPDATHADGPDRCALRTAAAPPP